MSIRVSGVATLALISVGFALLGACSDDGGTGMFTPSAGASGKAGGGSGGSAGVSADSSGGTESNAGGSSGSAGNGSGGDRNQSAAGGFVNEVGAGGAGTSGSGGIGGAGAGGSLTGAGQAGEAGSAGTGAGSGGAASCLRPYERYTVESLEEASAEGACNNDADLKAVCATDLVTVSARCAFSCSNAEEYRPCVSNCIRQTAKPPTSEACTVCYTDVVECIVDHCISICLDNPWGLKCRDCRRKHGCSKGFMACSGLPDPN